MGNLHCLWDRRHGTVGRLEEDRWCCYRLGYLKGAMWKLAQASRQCSLVPAGNRDTTPHVLVMLMRFNVVLRTEAPLWDRRLGRGKVNKQQPRHQPRRHHPWLQKKNLQLITERYRILWSIFGTQVSVQRDQSERGRLTPDKTCRVPKFTVRVSSERPLPTYWDCVAFVALEY